MNSPSRRARRPIASPPILLTGALALATLGLGVTSVWGLADPAGPAKAMLPLAAAHEARADALLRAGAPDAAQAEARRAVGQGPTRAVDWLQIAYADAVAHGRLGAAGLDALGKSYVFQPMGPEIIQWRLRFALSHWSELTPALRRQVRDETRALWRTNGRAPVEKALRAAPTPQARAVAALMLLQLKPLTRN